MYKYHLDRVRSETHEGKLVDYRLFYYDAASKSLDDGLDWLKRKDEGGRCRGHRDASLGLLEKGIEGG